MSESEWLVAFNAEFLRRTGITFADGGGTDREAIDRYYPLTPPADAVFDQMAKYDLDDVGFLSSWTGGVECD